jgi:hypothetical protein
MNRGHTNERDGYIRQDVSVLILQNSNTTFGGLPNDVLILIGEHLLPPLDLPQLPRDLIAMTWIHHRLRALLVSVQRLWAHFVILDGQLDAIATFSARAASHPLHISISGECPLEALRIWLAYLPRARSLYLDDVLANLEGTCTGDICAPLLQTVVMKTAYNISDIFAKIACPRLMSLTLHNTEFDQLPNGIALLHLDLQDMVIPLMELYTVLSCMPLLQTLRIANVFNCDWNTEEEEEELRLLSSTLTPVGLPALTDIVLEGSLEYTETLLRILPIPIMRLELDIRLSSFCEPETTFYSAWTSLIGPNAFIMSRIMQFCQPRIGYVELPPTGRVEYTGTPGHERVTVQLSGDSWAYQASPWMIKQDDPFLEHVAELELHTLDGMAEYPNLTPALSPSHLNLACLPNVQRLVIFEADFDNHGGMSLEKSLHTLHTWIHNKHKAGRPLQTVDFVGCSEGLRPMMHQLAAEGKVGSVTWKDAEG